MSEKILTQLRQLIWTCLYPRRSFASESQDFPNPFRGNWNQKVNLKEDFPFEGNWCQCFIENANPTWYILTGLQRSPEKNMGFEISTNWYVRTHPSFASHIILGKVYKPWDSFLVFKGDLTQHNLFMSPYDVIILTSLPFLLFTAARRIFCKYLLDNNEASFQSYNGHLIYNNHRKTIEVLQASRAWTSSSL